LKKKKDSVGIGTDYEHQKAKDYLMQQHRNSENSSITTKTTASEHSCKVSHQQNQQYPLTISCGRRQKLKHVKLLDTPYQLESPIKRLKRA
jgi:hypothetical protein